MKHSLKFIFVALNFAVLTCCTGYRNKQVRWKETVGVIDGGGRTFDIYFGEDYKARFYWTPWGQVPGEKYKMRYNIDDPTDVQIDYWSPVFEADEKKAVTSAKVAKIKWKNFFEPKYLIVFTFVVDGHKVKKEQCLPPHYKSKYPNLTENTFYDVEYDPKNPYRSVIDLDRPISEPAAGNR